MQFVAIDTSDAFSHYGVLGMKWGVRRYQDKNGKLTAAGRKKYGYDNKSGQYVKKSRNTRILERLSESGQKHAKQQDKLYESTKNPYNKKSAEQWRKESAENAENAKLSFQKDVNKKTLSKSEAFKQNKLLDVSAYDAANRKELENTRKIQKLMKEQGMKELLKAGYSKPIAEQAVKYRTEQLERYTHMGEEIMKHNTIAKKKIQDIDTSNLSYRKTKKLVKAILEENSANASKTYQTYKEEEIKRATS